MPLDAPVMRAMPLVWIEVMSVSCGLWAEPVASVAYLDPSANDGYLAKSRCILPKNGNIDGSSRSHVAGAGGRRGRQPVGRRACAPRAARDGQPESVRTRSAPADQAVQPVEPRSRAD